MSDSSSTEVPDLLVLATGARVKVAGDIEATVAAITIRERVVSHQVAYWGGRVRREEWVWEWEVTPCEPQARLRVGF